MGKISILSPCIEVFFCGSWFLRRFIVSTVVFVENSETVDTWKPPLTKGIYNVPNVCRGALFTDDVVLTMLGSVFGATAAAVAIRAGRRAASGAEPVARGLQEPVAVVVAERPGQTALLPGDTGGEYRP